MNWYIILKNTAWAVCNNCGSGFPLHYADKLKKCPRCDWDGVSGRQQRRHRSLRKDRNERT